MQPSMNALPQLCVAPLQYWWPREQVQSLYEDLADSAVDTVVLGEVVCSRRHEWKLADWLALGRALRSAGKQVLLATPTLVMGEADLRDIRAIVQQQEFALEAGDASVLGLLLQAGARSFSLGPHLNIYNRQALREHVALGATRWCAPAELPLATVASIGWGDASDEQPMPLVEAWAFGRLPLAFSARCFTARHYGLNKDHCAFRCLEHADGLAVRSGDGSDFLCLNGTQVQSAGVHALLEPPQRLRQAGIGSLRLAPCSRGFAQVVSLFDALRREALDAQQAQQALRELDLPGDLIDGFAHARPGMQAVAARALP